MRFELDCPFTAEEKAELTKLANAPLDFEVRVLQEQDEGGGYMHQSGRKRFEEKMRELGYTNDLSGQQKINEVLRSLDNG